MKTRNTILSMLVALLIVGNVNAQKEKLAVINFDTKGLLTSPAEMRKLVNHEMQKVGNYEVYDEYDMMHAAYKNEISLDNCYGSQCASEVGEKFGVDKVITGSVTRFGEKITYNIRLIDVKTKSTIKSKIYEFANQQPHIQSMSEIMINMLFDMPVNTQQLNELSFINTAVISSVNKLRASGPRMGIAIITPGETSTYLDLKDKYPVMSQFGYQAEAQYMSTGNFQALFEFVGLVSGMDQGMFIPTATFLNGFRNTKSGLEFALGPVFGLSRHVDFALDNNGEIEIDNEYIDGVSFNFAYAVGKTFKSGNLNIPINLYVSPNKKEGWFIGASMGFNLAKYSK